jgi:hypothetical protein
MKFYLIIIWVFLISNPINCLFKPDDFCKKNLTSSRIKNCMALDCGTKYCAFDRKTCDHFISWGLILKKWVKESKLYNDFIAHIKSCEQNDYKNQWSHRINFG